MSIPAWVRKWGASVTLGALLGGIAGGALLRTGVWVTDVNQHIRWGNDRSDEVKEQFDRMDRRQEWMIHVLYRLAAQAGVSMPALPAGIAIVPPARRAPTGAGLYAAEPEVKPVPTEPKRR